MNDEAPNTDAQRLLAAREGRGLVAWRDIAAADPMAACAVQRATVAALGGHGGWKVGAKGPEAEPSAAPLPARGIRPSGTRFAGERWTMRGIELEVALRLGRDLGAGPYDTAALADAVEAVVPAIEVVDTRFADWRESGPMAQLADLSNHGALVVGEGAVLAPRELDLRKVEAYLAVDGQPVATTFGANVAADVWRLLGWLAQHAAARGLPLRKGDVVTTGTCTGLLFAPEGAHVQGRLTGIGTVELHF